MSIIFYSWQSDRPNRGNRTLIGNAIERAIESLRHSDTIEPAIREALQLDQDTQGVAGSPDIAQAIFKKIKEAGACVFDVSCVNDEPSSAGSESDSPEDMRVALAFRRMPNPNVLIELGYAIAVHPPERIIMVCNTAFGAIEQLPFDIRGRRVLAYRAAANDASVADARTGLTGQIQRQLLLIHEHNARTEYSEREMEFWWRVFDNAHYVIDAVEERRHRLLPDGLEEVQRNSSHCAKMLRGLCSHETARSRPEMESQLTACAAKLDVLSKQRVAIGGMAEMDKVAAATAALLRERLPPCLPALAHKWDKAEIKLAKGSLLRETVALIGQLRLAVEQDDVEAAFVIRETLPGTGWEVIQLCQRLDVFGDTESKVIRPLGYAMHRATHRGSKELGLEPERGLLRQMEPLLTPVEELIRVRI